MTAMKFYDDVAAIQPLIEKTIAKFGYSPEHNFYWYKFCSDARKGEKNVFVFTEQGEGLLTVVEKKAILVFSGPMAPPERRVQLLNEYLGEALAMPGVRKVWLELETPLRREFLRALPDQFRANPINYTLTWPIMNLKIFDTALPGGHFKYLRKAKHKFYRMHNVEVVGAKTFKDPKSLHDIVDAWRKKRGGHDRTFDARYHNAIDGNFAGMSEARVFVVDGIAAGINTGWMIPNSNRYYGAIGVHNYAFPDLGLMLYLEDLEFLKVRGYGEADMAGGEAALTAFKNEFLPESYYRTHVFSVVKK